MTARGEIRARPRVLGRAALCCTALATGVLAAPLRADDAGSSISVEQPAGFESLARANDMLVDVYFGGVRVGEARVVAEPGSITFAEPDAVVALLPRLNDASVVREALSSARLPANAKLTCGQTGDPSECGRLRPDVAGVILDRGNFRVDVFVNPRFLATDQRDEKFLAASSDGLTMVNTFGAVLSGQSGAQSDYYALQNAIIVGAGDKRVRSTVTYAGDQGVQVPELTFEWDRPGIRYLAGAVRSLSGDFGAPRRMFGLGVQSQIDTRLDRDELVGSPLIAFLDRRSRVDVLVDGRVVHSAIYDAGNQRIETTGMPFGSYEIALRIQEPAAPPREERRLFSKNSRIPSMGRTDFSVFGGLLTKDGARSGMGLSTKPYLQGAVLHRVSEHWALEASAQAGNLNPSAQLGATFLASFASFRAGAFVDGAGNTGGLLQIASNGVSPLNFNFDIRRYNGTFAELFESSLPGSGLAGEVGFREAKGGYTQASGVISYAHANLRLLGTMALRQANDQRLRYSIGPSIEWDVLRKGPLSVALRSEVVATEEGQAGFAGVSVRLTGARNLFSSSGGMRHSSIANDSRGSGFETSLRGNMTTGLGQGELSLGAGYDRQANERNAIVTADIRHPLASVTGDFVRNDTGTIASHQYSLGLQSTLIVGSGVAALAGRTTSESMVVARLQGAGESDVFQVLVNDQVAGVVRGEGTIKLSLPAYRQYDLRLRSIGGSLVTYDTAARRVVLYPGSVTSVDWNASPIRILFGRLLTPDGLPVARASITGRSTWAETDENGFFQIESALNGELTVMTTGGATFALDLPEAEGSQSVVRLGAITCCSSGPQRSAPAIELASIGDRR